MYYIVIRESQPSDVPTIKDLVRQAYSSNVPKIWLSTLFNEVTFQAIVLTAAFMFILLGVPLTNCLLAIPIVLVLIYVLTYGSILMKCTEICYKRPLKCWVAEAYEPFFFNKTPKNCSYKILFHHQIVDEKVDIRNYKRTIIGTCAVMKHNLSDDWAWLFRLVVDDKYRKKGVGLFLTQTVKNWTRNNQFNCVELVVTENQDDARELFTKAGFQVRQLYHKKLFTSIFTMQMIQLRCEVRPTF